MHLCSSRLDRGAVLRVLDSKHPHDRAIITGQMEPQLAAEMVNIDTETDRLTETQAKQHAEHETNLSRVFFCSVLHLCLVLSSAQ